MKRPEEYKKQVRTKPRSWLQWISGSYDQQYCVTTIRMESRMFLDFWLG